MVPPEWVFFLLLYEDPLLLHSLRAFSPLQGWLESTAKKDEALWYPSLPGRIFSLFVFFSTPPTVAPLLCLLSAGPRPTIAGSMAPLFFSNPQPLIPVTPLRIRSKSFRAFLNPVAVFPGGGHWRRNQAGLLLCLLFFFFVFRFLRLSFPETISLFSAVPRARRVSGFASFYFPTQSSTPFFSQGLSLSCVAFGHYGLPLLSPLVQLIVSY